MEYTYTTFGEKKNLKMSHVIYRCTRFVFFSLEQRLLKLKDAMRTNTNTYQIVQYIVSPVMKY